MRASFTIKRKASDDGRMTASRGPAEAPVRNGERPTSAALGAWWGGLGVGRRYWIGQRVVWAGAMQLVVQASP